MGDSLIEKVVGHYLELIPTGDEYKAICPFHNEKTPSLSVVPSKEMFYCFGCGAGGDAIDFVKKKEGVDFKEALQIIEQITGISSDEVMKSKEGKATTKSKPVPLPNEFIKEFIKSVGYVSNGYRGIRDEINKFFGHLTKLNDKGEVVARYYPETTDGKLTGYTCRNHPKDFSYGHVGTVGSSGEMSGQIKFKTGGKYVLLVGGQEDKAAAYQMLLDSMKDQDFNAIPVVSPNKGENCSKQVAENYDWFNMFDNIIIGLDNDKAGKEAALKVAEVLPKEKVKIATWSGKDPNQMLESGKQKQFVRDFYNAKSYVDDGVISSIEADHNIEEELSRKKIPLPGFMRELQHRVMAGGIPLGYWVNWIAQTGVGKSTTVNEAIRTWIYESPYKVGILSLELTSSQYMIAMLSREVGFKINLITSPEEALAFVDKPDVKEARMRLRENDLGEERFALLDDREGTLEHVQKQIEKLINKHGCKLIVIDPINDLFDGVPFEEQAKFIKWMKVKLKYGITFCCVCHVNKTKQATTDKTGKRIHRDLTEDDVSGLSLITKSAGANLFLNRDKYAEDLVVQNTTEVTAGKVRWTGITGKAGKWYYDNQTHTMYDFDEYFNGSNTGIDSYYQYLSDMDDAGVEIGLDEIFN